DAALRGGAPQELATPPRVRLREIRRLPSHVRVARPRLRPGGAGEDVRATGRGARVRRTLGRRALPGGARPLRHGVDVAAALPRARGERHDADPAGDRPLDPAPLPSGDAGAGDPKGLAPALLILPYYHPVTLAREIQTLWHLSGGRLVLGVGPGWDQHEFETLGMKLSERGRRTDEMLAALRRVLTERDVSFAARYYRFEHATIEPRLARFPELWVGGGSKIQTSLSPDKPYIAATVLARITAADGWLARAAGSQQMVKDEVRAIRAYTAH